MLSLQRTEGTGSTGHAQFEKGARDSHHLLKKLSWEEEETEDKSPGLKST